MKAAHLLLLITTPAFLQGHHLAWVHSVALTSMLTNMSSTGHTPYSVIHHTSLILLPGQGIAFILGLSTWHNRLWKSTGLERRRESRVLDSRLRKTSSWRSSSNLSSTQREEVYLLSPVWVRNRFSSIKSVISILFIIISQIFDFIPYILQGVELPAEQGPSLAATANTIPSITGKSCTNNYSLCS